MSKKKRKISTNIDDKGRVVIPDDFRKRNNLDAEKWEEKKQVEIIMKRGVICITPFDPKTNWRQRDYVGSVRYLDYLGRACIPKGYRELLGLYPKCRIKMLVMKDRILILKEEADEAN